MVYLIAKKKHNISKNRRALGDIDFDFIIFSEEFIS